MPLLPFLSAAPAISPQKHAGVTQVFSHVMPSNFNGSPIAAIPHSPLKIRALRFIPDRQSIKVSQTIQAQSLAWPALTTDMLSCSSSSPRADIWAGMEATLRLFGSPPGQQILEYTSETRRGSSARPSGLALSGHNIWQTSKRGRKNLPTPARWEFWGFLRGKAHSVQAHTLGLQSFTQPWNYTVLSEELL